MYLCSKTQVPMREKSINIRYMEYDSIDEIPESYRILLEKAIAATENSYAPYSKFNVGAAVRMSGGEIVTGSNQENAASPSGLCAERVALFAAHHNLPNSAVEAIAIAAKRDGKLTEELTYPCAACLQVLAQSQLRGGKPIAVIIGSAEKVQIMDSVDALLPFSFNNLK